MTLTHQGNRAMININLLRKYKFLISVSVGEAHEPIKSDRKWQIKFN